MMKKFLIAILLCAAMTAVMVPSAFAVDSNYVSCMTAISEQRTVQTQVHQTAQLLRRQGYAESSPYIAATKDSWNDAQEEINGYRRLSRYTDEDVRILATTVYYEAGMTTEQLRQYVAQVVLNRVADSRFPNTIKGVITQAGQYSNKYSTTAAAQAIQTKDAKNSTYYYAICENAAKTAMMGRVEMPSNVIYQANFRQGNGIWKSVSFDSGWFASTSYFCYG